MAFVTAMQGALKSALRKTGLARHAAVQGISFFRGVAVDLAK
jgi:hypothetical protein